MTCEEMAWIIARAIRETSKEDEKWMYMPTEVGLIIGFGVGQIRPKALTKRIHI